MNNEEISLLSTAKLAPVFIHKPTKLYKGTI